MKIVVVAIADFEKLFDKKTFLNSQQLLLKLPRSKHPPVLSQNLKNRLFL